MISVVHIDDDEQFLALARHWILHQNPQTSVASFSSPAEALSYLLQGKDCDVIISDLQMPALDGLMVRNFLRLVDSKVPFILLTGSELVSRKGLPPDLLVVSKSSEVRRMFDILSSVLDQIQNNMRPEWVCHSAECSLLCSF